MSKRSSFDNTGSRSAHLCWREGDVDLGARVPCALPPVQLHHRLDAGCREPASEPQRHIPASVMSHKQVRKHDQMCFTAHKILQLLSGRMAKANADIPAVITHQVRSAPKRLLRRPTVPESRWS